MTGTAREDGPDGRCYQRVPEMEMVKLDRDTVVYDRGNSKVYVLNGSAAAILSLCDGSMPETEIARRLEVEFRDAPGPGGVIEDVRRTLEEFRQLGIVSLG